MRQPLFLRWIPWKFILRRAARSQGLLDPILLMSRLARFGRLGELATPGDLLRAGALLHARGLINNQAIQHNLDWVWPLWVERQFDPHSPSFIPRAFSLTHINLTHRNWTAAGFPGCEETPIVDPAGLVTPLFDGWSIDAWIVTHDGDALLPSRLPGVSQRLEGLESGQNLRIVTSARRGDLSLESSLRVEGAPPPGTSPGSYGFRSRAVVVYQGSSERPAWLALSFRPYNPEGVSFIHRLEAQVGGRRWLVNGGAAVHLSEAPERLRLSEYAEGDVLRRLMEPADEKAARAPHQEGTGAPPVGHLDLPTDPLHGLEVSCPVGMATGVALYRVPTGRRTVEVSVPLGGGRGAFAGLVARTIGRAEPGGRAGTPAQEGGPAHGGSPARRGLPADERRPVAAGGLEDDRSAADPAGAAWAEALQAACVLQVPDEKQAYLYQAALRTLLIHSPGEVYAGPYTYKRCWIRDTVMILNAMLCAGLGDRAEELLPALFQRQKPSGYFHSHDGEWDANGEVLWLLDRLLRFGGRQTPASWRQPLRRAADWIVNKRLPDREAAPHAGLLPAGFSAEHLGPNDYYYWDDFWGAAGLHAAARMAEELELKPQAERYHAESRGLLAAVDRSLESAAARLGEPIMPASPYRRMDTGSVGSLAGGYPLQLLPPRDVRLLNTAEYLMQSCLVQGGLFHDMSHSGINPYLTLHLAQVLLRAGDPRFEGLVEAVAILASPTGQWPEAVHPGTGGGCMGDGQHVWAAAEWVLMLRNRFVREEGEALVLGAGVPAGWLRKDVRLSLAPAPTVFGPVSLQLEPGRRILRLRCRAAWHGLPPTLRVRLPGFEAVDVDAGADAVTLELRRTR